MEDLYSIDPWGLVIEVIILYNTYYTGQRENTMSYFSSSISIFMNRRRVQIQTTSEMTPYFTMAKCNKLFITYLTLSDYVIQYACVV